MTEKFLFNTCSLYLVNIRALLEESESGEGSARSVCDDTFSVFAFLAFILALASLGFSLSGSSSKEYNTCTYLMTVTVL